MRTIWKWLTRQPSVPDLGDSPQHGLMVKMDGKSYRLVNVERLPGAEHSQVKLSFVPWSMP